MAKVFVALATTLVLAVTATAAVANRSIQLTPAEGELRSVTGRSTLRFIAGGINIECTVTRTMALVAKISKTTGTVVGLVTGVRIESCREGRVVQVLRNFPWTISYASFTGVLPNIAEVVLQIRGLNFLVDFFQGMSRCLYEGNVQASTRGNPITEIHLEANTSLVLKTDLGGVFPCPREGSVEGFSRISGEIRMTLQ